MDLGLSGKVALVAASSQGLGKATALSLAREGAKVVISGRKKADLDAAKAEIEAVTGQSVLSVVADVTSPTDIDRLVKETVEDFDTIHILVTNAGGPPPGVFETLKDEEWERAFQLTVMSSVRLTRAVLPYMRKQKWGRILNIASNSVKQPIRELLLSNSLRMSVLGWAKTLSNEVAADNITVNTVCPGWTRTERVTQLLDKRAALSNISVEEAEQSILATIPMGRMGRPEEFADVMTFLASERASFITGIALQVDGGTVKSPF